jgi:Mg-chelatase subunit ChlD
MSEILNNTTVKPKLFFLLGLCLLLVVGSVNAQSGRVQPTPTPPIDPDDKPVVIITEEVKVNILAFDAAGRFVADVNEEDLVITDNDILHQPASLRRVPANVLIVMDTGGELRSMKTLDQTRKTARALVDALTEDVSIALLQYADAPELVLDWTTDKNKVHAAILRTNFGRRSAFVKTVQMATEILSSISADNRHLVLITDGTDSFVDGYARQSAFREILATDINVHVITYTRMESASIEPRTRAITNNPPPHCFQMLPVHDNGRPNLR